MSKTLLLLACLAAFVYVSNSLAINEGSDIHAALKQFAKLVDKHHLNVSIIASENEYYSNGQIKEATSVTVHLPVNDHILHSPTLDEKNTVDFFKSMQKLNKHVNVAAEIKFLTVQDGEEHVELVKDTNDSLVIDSYNYEVLTNVENGVKGVSIEEPSYEILYNYIVIGENGKNETVQVVTAHVEVELLKKSETIDSKIIEAVKKTFPGLYVSTDDNTLLSHRLVTHLDSEFKNHNFQVMYQVPEDFYVASNNWALFEAVDTNFLVFDLSF